MVFLPRLPSLHEVISFAASCHTVVTLLREKCLQITENVLCPCIGCESVLVLVLVCGCLRNDESGWVNDYVL